MEAKTNRLDKIVANLRLKELEIAEKISNNLKVDSKVMRSLISPNHHNFIAINGDFEEVLGYSEEDCRNHNISMIMPNYEKKRSEEFLDKIKSVKDDFSRFSCDVVTKSGEIVKTSWRSKYYDDVKMVLSVGTVI